MYERHPHTVPFDAIQRAVTVIDGLTGDDPQGDHETVEELLLDLAPDQVEEAVHRLMRRANWWAFA